MSPETAFNRPDFKKLSIIDYSVANNQIGTSIHPNIQVAIIDLLNSNLYAFMYIPINDINEDESRNSTQ